MQAFLDGVAPCGSNSKRPLTGVIWFNSMKCLLLAHKFTTIRVITPKINNNLPLVVWNFLMKLLLHKNRVYTDNDSAVPLYESQFLQSYENYSYSTDILCENFLTGNNLLT